MRLVLEVFSIWKSFLSKKKNLLEVILTILFSAFFVFLFREFLVLVESWDHNLGVFNEQT